MKKDCPACGKKESVIHERCKKTQMLLFILGFLTFGVGWVALIIYRLVKRSGVCAACGHRIK